MNLIHDIKKITVYGEERDGNRLFRSFFFFLSFSLFFGRRMQAKIRKGGKMESVIEIRQSRGRGVFPARMEMEN